MNLTERVAESYSGRMVDLERENKELKREKALLHVRVEELEGKQPSSKYMLEIGPVPCAVSMEEYESLKADAEKYRKSMVVKARTALGPKEIGLAEYEQMKDDQKKWRENVLHAPDSEQAQQSIKDRQLGALVREMPASRRLVRTNWGPVAGKWAVTEFYKDTSEEDWHNTPEEALRAALGEPK